MAKHDIVIRVSGDTARDPGVISTGDLITLVAARAGLHIYTFRTFPAEIKGGQAMFQLRLADHLLLSQGDSVDVVLAFNELAYTDNEPDMSERGILLYDSGVFEPQRDEHRQYYGVPFTDIAKNEIQSILSKNMVAVGALMEILQMPHAIMAKMVADRFERKGPKVVQMNLDALEAGKRYVQEHFEPQTDFLFEYGHGDPKLVVTGNEALSIGAIAAGLRFYAGYPITPASDIMEYLQTHLPSFGGDVLQAEDEIAAIGMVLGASYAGKRAMTGTSGPGLSLMVEQINLAAMAEVPVVIVDVQRGGASTGMPTKTAQGDLNLAVFGVHNESPRIVIGLTSVEDCFYGIIRAFNLAEEFQCPVIVLSDQSLGPRKASIEKPDVSKLQLVERRKPTPEQLAQYRRYQITEDGISPMAIPGIEGGRYVATGIEHDEEGAPGYTPDLHKRMTQKRFKKLEVLLERYGGSLVRRYGDPNPRIGVIGWGSTEGVIREAVQRAQSKGIQVAALHPKLLYPLPVKPIQEFTRGLDAVIVPEVNYTGQFAAMLRSACGIQTIQLNKDEGIPFTPMDILTKIEEVASYRLAAD